MTILVGVHSPEGIIGMQALQRVFMQKLCSQKNTQYYCYNENHHLATLDGSYICIRLVFAFNISRRNWVLLKLLTLFAVFALCALEYGHFLFDISCRMHLSQNVIYEL